MTDAKIRTPMTDKEIRHLLGHGEGNRRVRIARDGHITYYGSVNDFDRKSDFWHEGGWRENYVMERGLSETQEG